MKEHIDDIFRKNIDERSFEFEDSLWDDISEQLDQKEKKKRRPFFWIISGVLLPFVFLATVYTFAPSGEKAERKLPESFVLENKKEVPTELENIQSESAHEIVESAPIIQKESESEAKKKAINFNEKNPIVTKSEITFVDVEKSNFETNRIVETSAGETENIQKNEVLNTNFIAISDLSETEIKNITEVQRSDNQIFTNEEKPVLVEIKAMLEDLPILEKIDIEKIEFEEANDADLEKVIIPANSNFNGFWNFGLIAKGGVDNYKNDLSGWGAGVFGTYRFSKSFSAEAAAIYGEFSGDFGAGQSSIQTNYGFGVSRTQQTLKVQKLSLLQFPITLNFYKKRHQIGAGIQMDYLLTSRGQKDIFEEEASQFARVSTEKGITPKSSEIPGFNFSAIAGYQYNLPRFSLGLRGGFYMKNYLPQLDTDPKDLMTLDLVFKFNLK